MPDPVPWQPDDNLIDHARLCPVSILDMSGPDRAWVVAGLSAAGWTAEETARALKCSLRLIRQIRAEPMCTVATYALTAREQHRDERFHLTEELRHAHRRIAGLRGELARITNQRNQLIESRIAAR